MSDAQPIWHPGRMAHRATPLRIRAQMIRAIREFFWGQDFIECETPALQVSPGLEPHLQAFKTQFVGLDRKTRRDFYLHTSPEFAIKKLLVAGWPNLFQICRVFRNGEQAQLHQPEFTMIEWYRADATYRDIMADTEAMVRHAAEACGLTQLRHGAVVSDPFGAWDYLTVAEAFDRHAGIDILATIGPDDRNPDVNRLAPVATEHGYHVAPDDRWDDLFFRIFLDKIEPKLGAGVPTILYDYPISMAALSRQKAQDPRLAERFELYICGLELANAFGELTDPAEQARRFEADMALKEQLYGERYPIDADFIAALEQGMPEAGGIALGIDRLAMVFAGVEHIDEVCWLPVDTAHDIAPTD
ncbi:MAG: EF-P lysine aminoacylase EpmA [Pseudomonadota bacterium]